MRSRLSTLAAPLLVTAALLATACGGDDSDQQRTTPNWQPSDRLPSMATHWWWDPVERYCDDSTDCASGEHCQQMDLGTCPGCPQGEDARICLDQEGRNAAERTRRESPEDPEVRARPVGQRTTSNTSSRR